MITDVAPRAPLRSWQDLAVWQRAVDLCVACHRVADAPPPVRRFGLGAQMRRAAGSVPANMAEGYGRMQRREHVHHLAIARGSLEELETHLVVAYRLRHIDATEVAALDRLCWRVSRMLSRLIVSLCDGTPPRRSPSPPSATSPRRGAGAGVATPESREA